MKIGFIGTGNMGGAIMRGYGKYAAERGDELYGFNRTRSKLEAVCRDSGASPLGSIGEVVETCDIFVISMEPKQIREHISEITEKYDSSKLAVSIAAGVTIDWLESHFGKDAMIVRVMPNMPIRVGEGMASLSRNSKVTDRMFTKVLEIFEAAGRAEETDEDIINTIGAVSGSSPAYTYMYIDAMARCGEANGMEYDQAVRFAAQSVLGAAKVVLESDDTPHDLAMSVCTEGGSTIEGYNVLKENGFEKDIQDGLQAAIDKNISMSKGE
ncbi:MAG: pyrroline-5-carboxylate reductase [Anaerovoracaceae bacterium]|nr:pyrroline-5-carboxylate reductase [Anaerovoracaceae bacterium]